MVDEATEPKEGKQHEEIQRGSGQRTSNSVETAVSSATRDDEKGIEQSTTVFFFWGCVVAFVTSVTVVILLISSIMPLDEEMDFFSMPTDVRQHYAMGKLLKIDIGKDRRPVKVFVRDEGTLTSSATVLLCHGLGMSSFGYRSLISAFASHGLRVIALDFPGAGLSEKPIANHGGLMSKLRDIYNEIAEKGLLWRFEQMFETGSFPESTPANVEWGVRYDADDLSESISQVLSLLASPPVHVVVHDTSVEAGLVWATQNPTLVRSITLLDTYPGTPSFPVGLLGIPGLGFLILRSSVFLQSLLQRCCVTRLTKIEAKSFAFLLRIRGGQGAVLKSWEMANTTFDLISTIEKLGDMPVHLMWSNSSGKHWQELGDWVASQLPAASYVSHSGGRWPQEDKVPELAEDLYSFIMSLPSINFSIVDTGTHEDTYELPSGNDDCMTNTKHQFHHLHHGPVHDDGHQHDNHNLGHSHDQRLGYMDHMDFGGWVI